jgi:hypothetical protein
MYSRLKYITDSAVVDKWFVLYSEYIVQKLLVMPITMWYSLQDFFLDGDYIKRTFCTTYW